MKSGIEHTGGDEAGGLTPLVLFLLEGRRYALPLEAVEAVLRAVAVTGLPRAPEAVRGVVDYHGDLLPVMDPRVPLCHPTREVQPSDHFIVAQTSRRRLLLMVDRVLGLERFRDEELLPGSELDWDLQHVGGVVRTDRGLVLIQDLETFLTPGEEAALLAALQSDGE